MKTSTHSEKDLESFPGKLPAHWMVIHFKMVGIGPNALKRAEFSGAKLCQIVREQPGFFVLSQDGTGLREAMHDLVDRFCNAQEGQDESKIEEST
jgi:hypothetical protein